MNEIIYEIWLTLIEGVGPRTSALLVERFQSAVNIYKKSYDELIAAGVSVNHANNIVLNKENLLNRANLVYELCVKSNIKTVSIQSSDYPKLLKETTDAPHILYVRGNLDLNRGNFVSIVGTREASTYGLTLCRGLVEQLKDSVLQPVTVSGLALGIDKCAHTASIENNIPTVAVMAGWVDDIVPQSHFYIARQIIEKGGAIVSDMPPGTIIKGANFLSRNRIIAGLSSATVVVESKSKGGSMVTADIASSYNRDVFAPIGDGSDSFQGNVNLIKANKALVYQNIGDIISELNWTNISSSVGKIVENVDKDLLEYFSKLPDNAKFCIDEVVDLLDISVAQASRILSRLELAGLLSSLHGRMYVKTKC